MLNSLEIRWMQITKYMDLFKSAVRIDDSFKDSVKIKNKRSSIICIINYFTNFWKVIWQWKKHILSSYSASGKINPWQIEVTLTAFL